MQILLIIVVVAGGLALLGWIGLRIRPRPLPVYPGETTLQDAVPLPDGLPAPVQRFFELSIGDRVPVIHSAVITGSGTFRFLGLRFRGRWRFTHLAGQGYRHYMDTTLFGIPVFKVNEWYLDGRARLELPFGVVEGEPKVDSAANLGLWAESVWLPSIWVTDPRVRWEAVEASSARLIVPAGDGEEAFDVHFDPATGLLSHLEVMRWRNASDPAPIRWHNQVLGWQSFHGFRLPSPASLTWLDQGAPWAVFEVEDVAYNVDVAEYIRARGS